MSRPIIKNQKTWPRNLSTGLSTGLGGGLSKGLYGGLSTGPYGALSSGLGGGMSTSNSNIYSSNIPPWPVVLKELDQRGYWQQAELIRRHLPKELWPENFF